MKIAFIYPGQGAQYAGMGKEIYEKYEEAKEIFERADEALGFNISKLCFEGPEEELMKTENTQPAILTVSVALTRVLQKRGVKPDVTAGLSLGEYSSLVLAEALDFEDAVRLVKKRGKYMQEVVPEGVGTMAAILGLPNEEVEEICRIASEVGVVEPANYNCPGQLVVSGEVKAVERAVELAKERGAKKAVVLAVSAPFHCSMLKEAGELLAKELDKVEIKDLKVPVISNVTADYVQKDKVKELLIKQVSHPVLWEQSVRKMIEDGVDTFIEIGPGKTLSGFVKKIDRSRTVLNFEDEESLMKALSALGV
ncbi:MAG: Malonyl CoA-acyl carrier protein transacylase [Caldanaerobacter subterraneus]|jgi:[acyl-carrier-protein] S-malonyltransferase|uniref:Malonyl CoA-acyl carrier protein transacylase n=2 Tax=Caldanaerobacter subterraneus TaxID=911092 RepID=Q8R9V9_CALS4|nr:ACP S-malonyltransferase [Caldanaerobacter subterraneus]AAM24695.1 (acyl-carrier-protein) S-malonyltransferase [Caldanaerobacter subterraneus subsp. tengcongensis MB4]KUK09912.1 MAG: Malonyl CoA-acyl carrier protein transacylase [Caldanaerobacter subterraneus]MCS3915743.1 [acyl-carrier-protein] S-malonyltransferase [Caldanaerobacter subterraneus subsp. tengcongensis MB4]TCO67831.1 [acyl-carrier-protein] S-malonyltransferase [Caldanaerobacter subterraneus]HBT49455.1 [acyl-carrier-protein] S-